ncbi:UDP-N-acetylmuramoyl-L-alanyl-D-glutamate--2,6-diaminopimelate ligase [Patulibacter brassicae]|jgi:UDP-N-acetylmuramoyl-L-alanyl-D-glutamate--2,6-diaminopimelate ligase|uniref:UDP-N-acetylmuramoyl-L-alanyl-D-glutamate--2,6-diaminopimelate ligase n=1 Tax=Patulibacter brassicae TaxID=1705717 RepID=A0ABU4VPV8_9ACTN|nr:UDP-N-acetylmuramoyl-L-alanyl-D-glutamate--2,6-diaminopimelate ligase [Patulibacter brassicae]MDX8153892.1 UDP-N-acetylmuramoyl-L-alanyl-D-glutamate--2,6-diaminopimelate ligase [Patulibacter brassicae]
MTLGELFDGVGPLAAGVPVTALAYDHRRVAPGTAFFCVRGLTRDGHDFAPDAVAAGASALIVDHELDLGVPQVVVPDVRAAMAPAAARLAGDPTARLVTVGITGTNGKTTTAFLVRELLEAAGRPTGLLGTVTQVVGGEVRDAGRTTPEAIDLQPTFAAMLAGGDEACVMEVSSHALALGRADAIHWSAAIFTNLTQDHLDFHDGMEDYFEAKARLFAAAGDAPKVVDLDDPYGRRLALRHRDAITVSIDAEDAMLRATDVVSDLRGSRFVVGGRELRTPLTGRFNVRNALQAYAVAVALGVAPSDAAAALAGAGRVPGRLEPVDAGQPFAVLVDYAHTPDALETVLRAAREAAGEDHRVLCAFGCGGDRDRGKRPLMGAIAARDADLAVVTSDNPRSEDPEAILDAIQEGIAPDAVRGAVERIADRRAAIARVVGAAGPGDVVLIAGKGHEQGQVVGDRTLPFDDVAEARRALHALGHDGEAARA